MIYERWPDADEVDYLIPEDYWPECDPGGDPPLTSIHALLDAFRTALDPISKVVHAALTPSPYIVTYSGKTFHVDLASMRGITPWLTELDDNIWLMPRTPKTEEMVNGYKTLRNGRKMPVIIRNTGPRGVPFKNRGSHDTVGRSTQECTGPKQEGSVRRLRGRRR